MTEKLRQYVKPSPWATEALDALIQQRDAAIERAEKASQAENDAVAAFHLANQARDKMQRERASLRSTITQKDEQIEDVIAALARWVDNDPSVSPGENIRMMQDALAQQLSESEKERERLRGALERWQKAFGEWDNGPSPGSKGFQTEHQWMEYDRIEGVLIDAAEFARQALSTPETGETK